MLQGGYPLNIGSLQRYFVARQFGKILLYLGQMHFFLAAAGSEKITIGTVG